MTTAERSTEALLLDLPIDSIQESTTNPRQHFDDAGIGELMASIGQLGIQVPLLVRPMHGSEDGTGNVWELVSGARRLRAAKAIGLISVPCLQREMTDVQAREAQIVENLQRADVHPVEEAEAYRQLIADSAAHGLGRDRSAEDIARRLGKSTAYVAQRLKLLDLELDAKLLYAKGHLTLGHALLLARLTPKDQESALRFLLNGGGDYQKMTITELIASRVSNLARLDGYGGMHGGRRLVDATEAQLKAWVGSNVLLQLKEAPWRLDDEDLVRLAGACVTCPKRSGSNVALFGDLTAEEDVCLDAVCFDAKQKAFIAETAEQAKTQGAPLAKLTAKAGEGKLPEMVTPNTQLKAGQWVLAEPGSCPSAVKGLMRDGREAGKILTVCANQACKVHKHRVDQPQSASSVAGKDKEIQAKREAKDKSLEERERAIRKAVCAVMLLKAKKSPLLVMRRFVANVIDNAEDVVEICRGLGLEFAETPDSSQFELGQTAIPVLANYVQSATEEQLAGVMFHSLVAEELNPRAWMIANRLDSDREDLWKTAKALGVDATAVAKRAEQQLDKPKAVPATKAVSKPAAAKPKVAATGQKSKRKTLSPESRKRIADAMAKRWSAARAKPVAAKKKVTA